MTVVEKKLLRKGIYILILSILAVTLFCYDEYSLAITFYIVSLTMSFGSAADFFIEDVSNNVKDLSKSTRNLTDIYTSILELKDKLIENRQKKIDLLEEQVRTYKKLIVAYCMSTDQEEPKL